MLLYDSKCTAAKMNHRVNTRPRGYKTVFMLNSTEQEISTAFIKYRHIKTFLAFRFSGVVLSC